VINLALVAPIQKCPYCGSNEGYYSRMQVSGSILTRFHFDGSEAENGEMYETVRHTGGKIAYCLVCNKRIFRMDILS